MKLMHYTAVAILALFMGYVGAHLAPSGNTAQTEIKKETAYERVLRTGILRCGYAMWPPAGFIADVNTKKFSGVMYDVTEALAKSLSIKIEWVEETGWSSWIEGVNTGRFDMFCAGSVQNAARSRQARFTNPLFYLPVHAYARIDDKRFDNGLDILYQKSIRISGQDGDISDIIARTIFPASTYVGLPQLADLSGILVNVADGKADLVFSAADVAASYMAQNPNKLKRVTQDPFQVSGIAYGIAMHEDDLQQMLNGAIIEAQNSGLINKIMRDNKLNPEFFLQVNTSYKKRLNNDRN